MGLRIVHCPEVETCSWCEGDGVVAKGGEKPIRSDLFKQVVDALDSVVTYANGCTCRNDGVCRHCHARRVLADARKVIQ